MSPSSFEALCEYFKAMSDTNYDKLASYYNPDLNILMPNNTKHESKESFLQSLPVIHSFFKETIIPQTILTEGDRSFVLMDCYFEALRDVPEEIWHVGKDFKFGDVMHMVLWAFYKWKNGKISSIECFMRETKVIDAANANIDQLFKESRDRADANAKL